MAVAGALGSLAGSLLACAAWAGPAREQGVAQLDISAEPRGVTLQLEMPLQAALGFEHPPRNDDERQQAESAVTRLRTPGALFRIDPAAHCTPGRVDLQSAALGLGAAAGNEAGVLRASYEFDCKNGYGAGFVHIGLFEFFPRLQRVDVQTTTRRGQLQAHLKRPVTRVPLAR